MTRKLRQNFTDAGIEITAPQWQVLVQLWHHNGRTQQDLAKHLCKDKTSITRLIDNLEKSEIVFRQEDETDRRTNHIFLTPKGKKMLEPSLSCAETTLKEATSGILESDLEICKSVLRKIFQNLSEEENICSAHSSDDTENQSICGLED